MGTSVEGYRWTTHSETEPDVEGGIEGCVRGTHGGVQEFEVYRVDSIVWGEEKYVQK